MPLVARCNARRVPEVPETKPASPHVGVYKPETYLGLKGSALHGSRGKAPGLCLSPSFSNKPSGQRQAIAHEAAAAVAKDMGTAAHWFGLVS